MWFGVIVFVMINVIVWGNRKAWPKKRDGSYTLIIGYAVILLICVAFAIASFISLSHLNN